MEFAPTNWFIVFTRKVKSFVIVRNIWGSFSGVAWYSFYEKNVYLVFLKFNDNLVTLNHYTLKYKPYILFTVLKRVCILQWL